MTSVPPLDEAGEVVTVTRWLGIGAYSRPAGRRTADPGAGALRSRRGAPDRRLEGPALHPHLNPCRPPIRDRPRHRGGRRHRDRGGLGLGTLRPAPTLHHRAGDRGPVDPLAVPWRRDRDGMAGASFAFVIFYAGPHTVNQDTLGSAVIDGASRWERLRYAVIPHRMPLIAFIALIHLMDVYLAFEEVVGPASKSYRITRQYLRCDHPQRGDAGNRPVPPPVPRRRRRWGASCRWQCGSGAPGATIGGPRAVSAAPVPDAMRRPFSPKLGLIVFLFVCRRRHGAAQTGLRRWAPVMDIVLGIAVAGRRPRRRPSGHADGGGRGAGMDGLHLGDDRAPPKVRHALDRRAAGATGTPDPRPDRGAPPGGPGGELVPREPPRRADRHLRVGHRLAPNDTLAGDGPTRSGTTIAF